MWFYVFVCIIFSLAGMCTTGTFPFAIFQSDSLQIGLARSCYRLLHPNFTMFFIDMSIQISFSYTFVITILTRIRFLTSMNFLMPIQRWTFYKGFVTVFTSEIFFSYDWETSLKISLFNAIAWQICVSYRYRYAVYMQ